MYNIYNNLKITSKRLFNFLGKNLYNEDNYLLVKNEKRNNLWLSGSFQKYK